MRFNKFIKVLWSAIVVNMLDFAKKKRAGEKVSMVTCYDYTSARILAQTRIDCLLVGDSVAMTMHGFDDTLAATMEMMCTHTSAVKRGAQEKFIVTDMPFMSYRKSFNTGIEAAEVLMRAGANAVKLEGAAGNLELINHLVESGVPVMGHLGLTPQSIHTLGGYKVQGTTENTANKIKADALLLQNAGCFALVLECLPSQLAYEITKALAIPVIGIGAGSGTDGQVLVYQDLLGLNIDFKPKFVKQFANGFDDVSAAIDAYVNAIQTGEFPQDEHCYGLNRLAAN